MIQEREDYLSELLRAREAGGAAGSSDTCGSQWVLALERQGEVHGRSVFPEFVNKMLSFHKNVEGVPTMFHFLKDSAKVITDGRCLLRTEGLRDAGLLTLFPVVGRSS
jgi:hypothetical protein